MPTQPSITNSKRPIIADVNPKSPISEAYRTLRTNIDFSNIDEELKTIMLTSAGPAEGKSTTATNLAVVYAQNDRKVLIVDADLRKPTMHHTFNKSNRWGLTNVLTGKTQLSDVISETHVPNLHVLPSGPIPPNPSEILASKRMTVVLGELRNMYDLVIVDTPPALAVADAQIMATKCDGVILVIYAGSTKRDAIVKVKANMDHVKANVIGAVLNNVDRKSGEGYYYYYYGSRDE